MASIPIGGTISAAFGRVFGHMNQAFAVVLPYAVLQIIVSVIGFVVLLPILYSATGVILFLIFIFILMLIYAAMLVAWHRVTLLGYAADKGLFRVGLSSREWRFLGYSLLVYPLMIALILICYAAGSMSETLGWLVSLAAIAVFIYLTVRSCLVLPATAADHPTSLKTSWQQTAGHFWPMFVVFIVLFLIFFVALLIVAVILGFIFGQSLTGTIIQQLVLVPIQLLGICVSVSALSYIYRILSGHPDPLAETP
jgi:hypothetical protein